ncbi:MAG: C13 family peptidase [Methylomonas sp.]|nr:C13 family peptidase [Methylomonas sp.]
MEIRYRLQLSDLEGLRRHLMARLRREKGSAIRRMAGWAVIGALASLVLHGLEGNDVYDYAIWLLPSLMLLVSAIWLPLWHRSRYGRRWLEQFAGEYLLELTAAGISYRWPDGRAGFYGWSEIKACEITDSDLYLYLRRDVAIPVPLSELGSDAERFAERVRRLWAEFPEHAGKLLPDAPKSAIPAMALLTNLLQGVRAAFFMDFDAGAFRVGVGPFLQLLLLDLVCIGLVDYADALPVPEFNVYGLSKFGVATLLMLGGATSICHLILQRAQLLRLLIAISAAEVVVHVIYFSGWLAAERWLPDFREFLWALFYAAMAWTLTVVFNVVRLMFRQPAPTALFLAGIYGFFMLASTGLLPSERLYYGSEAGAENSSDKAAKHLDTEEVFYRQAGMVEEEVAGLKAQRPGKTDLYFVGFAGQAAERVFFNDVSYARNLMNSRFDTLGRSLVLVNNIDTVNSVPLANRHNLKAVLRGVARRMDRNEDVLFLFLSSHGAQDHKLSVSFWPMRLNDLTAEDLKAMLDEVGIVNRVIAVSACYSGGFLDVLKDDNTLVMTASSRDHMSYGCGDFTEYTYFAESYFVKSLAQGDSFVTAFEKARNLIAAREAEEGLDASAPQIDVGRNISRVLQNLDVLPAGGHPDGGGWKQAGISLDQRLRQARRFEQDATVSD